jgi:serine/threonine-protein kinase
MSSPPTEDRLEVLLQRWDERRRQGEDVPAERLCVDCPELAAELSRRIQAVLGMEPVLNIESTRLLPKPQDRVSDGTTASCRIPDLLNALAVYRPQRHHAHGGLGEVLTAHQEELDRLVAIKRIRPDRLHGAARQRFLREAAITAGLQHPGIVPIYGLGQDEDGPFYTMPFIQGQTLQEAIEGLYGDESLRRDAGRRSLEFRSLLQRFIAVCNTVAYAHDQGVVHRDLKPSNIMLGPYGETLVMDWGLAKSFAEDGPVDESNREARSTSPSPDHLTATGAVLGTPQYMSPEQAKGQPAEPASDIFSLGIILYAILTGKSPYENAGPGGADPLREVRDVAIVPPRDRDPRLPRALEAICFRALAARPEDRFTSTRDLARDLENWLADEPVTAWCEPWTTRLARWGRRHRSLVTGVVATLLVASASISVATILLSKERDRSMENLRESRRVVAAMFDRVVPKLADQRDMDTTQHDILESALQFYEGFVLRRDRAPDVRHEVGRAYQKVGSIQDRLGRSLAAETAYLRGVAILDSLAAEHPTRDEYRRSLAATLNDLARLYNLLGRPAEAEQALRRSLGLRLELAGAPDADSVIRRDLALCYYSLAYLLDRNTRWDEAEDLYQQAAHLQEKLAADFPETGEYRSDLAANLYELGYLYDRTNRRPEATKIYERLVAIQEELLSDFPGVASYRSSLTASLSYLGAMYRDQGRLAEAERAGRRAVSVQEKLVADHPDIPSYRSTLAANYLNQGNLYRNTNRLDEADGLYQKAYQISDSLASEHPERIDYVVRFAGCHEALSQVSENRGDLSEALARLDRAIVVYQSALRRQPGHAECRRHLNGAYHTHAATLTRLGRHAEALTDWDRAIALADDPVRAAANRLGRALTLAHLGDYTRALGEVADLTSRTTHSGIAHYTAACIEALYSTAVLRDPLLRPAEREDRAARNAASLKRAEALSYFQVPLNYQEFLGDRDLDPLRSRPDFQDLLRDLAFPTNPFAP